MHRIDNPVKKAATVLTRLAHRRPYVVLALVVFAAIAYPLITRKYSEWNEVFVRAAKHLRAGDGIYHFGEGYVYPPFMAFLATPFSYLSRHASLIIWYLINVAATFVLCRYAWRLAIGSTASCVETTKARWIWLLGLACGIRYVFDGLSHQQTDIVIAALLMFACWSLFRSHSWIAAICFGLAAGASARHSCSARISFGDDSGGRRQCSSPSPWP